MRLLIVRLSALGDVVHTLPVAASAAAGGHEVGWLVERPFAPLLEGNPAVRAVFPAETRTWRRAPLSAGTRRAVGDLRGKLRGFGFDAVLDVQGLWKSAWLSRLAGAPVTGFVRSARREGLSAILAHRGVLPGPRDRHVVEKNLALLSALGIDASVPAPDARYLLPGSDPESAAFLATVSRPFALYHPGAGRPDKVWGEEKLALLAERLRQERGLWPVISWGPGDEARVESLAKRLAGRVSVAPRTTIPGLARLAAAAALFVGGDTGPLHLANAVGTRVVALFGPTDPARNGPFGQQESVVRFGPGDLQAAFETALRVLPSGIP
jgi:lipopolysaccharide heptosyltransferase I